VVDKRGVVIEVADLVVIIEEVVVRECKDSGHHHKRLAF